MKLEKKKEFILNSISRSSSVWVIAGCHTRAGEEVCKKNTQVHMHREDKSVKHSFVAPLLKKTHTHNKNLVASLDDVWKVTVVSYSQLGVTGPESSM